MFQQNLITNLLGIANVFVDKIENNSTKIEIYLSTQAKEQVCPCCKKLQSIFTIIELKRYEIFPLKAKKLFYSYANAVIFVKLVANVSLKSMIFFQDIDISQVEFMCPF